MIKIVDYGLGNVLAFQNAYRRLNIDVTVARNVTELQGSSKLILPGVGSFDRAMHLLQESGMRGKLDDLVLRGKIPVLGICVGMQMLAVSSDEGKAKGLAWIDGSVHYFGELGIEGLQIPHMGWNDVKPVTECPLFRNLEVDARFYFLHSYYFRCKHRCDEAAVSGYGVKFSSAVQFENVYGVQFHPEKSHRYGMQLLRNFAEL